MGKLFIPKKIRVGYQGRKDTYTGKLAYVIYYDAQGKLRKETSWNSWRSDDIEPNEFDNEPIDGFILNKEVQRFNWSHFGSNRSYIRIYDPRGIEFEITPDNLIGLLMECDCNRRMLDGKFVYAWKGTELILLPCGSESYKQAVEYTERQGKKVSARDLKKGCSYTLKNGDEVIYMGRYPWYRWNRWGDKPGREMKKQHIFWDSKDFDRIVDMKKLSYLNSPEPVQEYASLVEKLNDDFRVNEIVGWEIRKHIPEKLDIVDHYGYKKVDENIYFKINGDYIFEYILKVCVNGGKRSYLDNEDYVVDGYYLSVNNCFDIDKFNVTSYRSKGGYYPQKKNVQFYTEKEVVEALGDYGHLYVKLESGKEQRMESIYHIPGAY